MNTYKVLTFTFAGLLTLAILRILIPTEDDRFLDRLSVDLGKQELLFDSIIDPDSTGALIPISDAIEKMEAFNSLNRRDSKEDSLRITPYAFSFGRTNFDSLFARIDRINELIGDNKEKRIQGLRVYLTWRPKADSSHLDILAVPVRGNGDDYIQLSYKDLPIIDNDSLILNTSAPCPNNCDGPSLKNNDK